MRSGRRLARWGALPALATTGLLCSCGAATPSAAHLLQEAGRTMATSSYQLTGGDRAGQARVSFSLRELPSGAFSGAVQFSVPPSPVLSTEVVSLGPRVWVLSAAALAQLGITSLPGHLNPATTWVLQPSGVGVRYRQSVAPFVGAGLETTLEKLSAGRPLVSATEFSGAAAWRLQERGRGGESLTIYLQRQPLLVLQLQVSGPDGFEIRYSDFGQIAEVTPPPPTEVYVPPTPAPGT
ncbi:MAG: hypothetical protein M0T72_04855 [Candidatus Dormibacteraeota bacterium]|nr:hypothetical protein [Candidatus Dormibacteraeota bacterium]